jgi:hypothetical protein
MWKIIVFLWSAPLAFALLIVARVAAGSPAVREREWRLLFGGHKEMTVSLWMGLQFAALAVLFFIMGLVEGLVLINIGGTWLVMVPLVTGLGATLLVAQWIRWGSRENRISRRATARSHARESRTPSMISR